MLSILQRTRASAEALARKAAPYALPIPSSPHIPPMSDLVLPPAQPLASELVALGLGELPAQRISDVVLRAATRIKGSLEDDYKRRRCHIEERSLHIRDPKIPVLVLSAYSSMYSMAIQRWRHYVIDRLTPRVMSAFAVQQRTPEGLHARRPFNQSAVPILEDFFHKNAFPSKLDKLELAGRCEMTYRQIGVWFQNRRSRCRKEGRQLMKPEPSYSFLEELHDAAAEALIPVGTDEEDLEDPADECQMPDTFNLDAPRHAYPSPYPPQCSYDPFPGEGKRVFPAPWIRDRKSETHASSVPDVSELVVAFAKLTIADGADNDASKPSHPVWSPRLPLGFVTPCVRAPLPALIRRPRWVARGAPRSDWSSSHPRTRVRQNRTVQPVRRDACKVPGLQTSEPMPTSQSLSPAAFATRPQRTKKALPRRVPRNPPVLREGGETTTSATGTVFPPSASRITSTSSLASHSDSSISDVDTPLTTPLLTPTDLVFGDIFSSLGHHNKDAPANDILMAALSQRPSQVGLNHIAVYADTLDHLLYPSVALPSI